jgi:hypothetical protein
MMPERVPLTDAISKAGEVCADATDAAIMRSPARRIEEHIACVNYRRAKTVIR